MNMSTMLSRSLFSSLKLLLFWRYSITETACNFISLRFFPPSIEVSKFAPFLFWAAFNFFLERRFFMVQQVDTFSPSQISFLFVCYYYFLGVFKICLVLCNDEGLVRSPITATLPQIGSRLYLTWIILYSFPEVGIILPFKLQILM